MQKNYFIILLTFILSLSFVSADSNGIWFEVEDLRGSVFGLDEENVKNFSFIKTVNFFSDLFFGTNQNPINVSIHGEINLNGNRIQNASEPLNPSDLTTKSYVDSFLNIFAPKPPVCTGSNALQWDGTSWNCVSMGGCSSQNSFSCYSGDVYWFDSCNNRESKKEECGISGCSSNSCNTPLTWYQQYAGTFSSEQTPGQSNYYTISLTVSSTGSITGTFIEKYYLTPAGGGEFCIYGIVYSDHRVKFSKTEGPSSCLPGDGLIYTQSQAESSGFGLIQNSYNILGVMNSAGSITGSGTHSSGATLNFNGQGNSDGTISISGINTLTK